MPIIQRISSLNELKEGLMQINEYYDNNWCFLSWTHGEIGYENFIYNSIYKDYCKKSTKYKVAFVFCNASFFVKDYVDYIFEYNQYYFDNKIKVFHNSVKLYFNEYNDIIDKYIIKIDHIKTNICDSSFIYVETTKASIHIPAQVKVGVLNGEPYILDTRYHIRNSLSNPFFVKYIQYEPIKSPINLPTTEFILIVRKSYKHHSRDTPEWFINSLIDYCIKNNIILHIFQDMNVINIDTHGANNIKISTIANENGIVKFDELIETANKCKAMFGSVSGLVETVHYYVKHWIYNCIVINHDNDIYNHLYQIIMNRNKNLCFAYTDEDLNNILNMI